MADESIKIVWLNITPLYMMKMVRLIFLKFGFLIFQNISYDRGKGSEITLRMYDDWMKNPYEIEVIDDTPESIMLAIFEGAILKGYK
jgi:hypothetical protein